MNLYQKNIVNQVNILILSQFFSSTKGGGEYIFSLMARKLAEEGHKVWIITNKIKGEQYPNHQNMHFIMIPPTLEYEGGIPPSFSDNLRFLFNAISKGTRIIKNEDIDIIHSNNFAPAFAGAILSFLTSKPHITAIWDIFTLCGKDYWKRWGRQSDISKIHAVIGSMFEKLIVKIPCKAFHTISQATNDDLLKFGVKKPIYVICPAIEKKDSQSRQNPFHFIYIGRLVFYKNIEVLIKAINIVRKTEPQIRLAIVGGGPHKSVIRNLINELNLESHIKLTDYISTKEKFDLLSQSNALVFPSLCEGFGLVILEAFSQNKPVLVSNVKPMSSIVSHNITGYVLDPHDEVEWANKMLELIKNPEISLKMGRLGRERLEKEYSIQKMYEEIIKMYENFV